MIDRIQDSSNDLSSSPIRSQLLWATLFPLVLFGLLSTLVIATFLFQHTLDLVSQRNTAQINTIAKDISKLQSEDALPNSQALRSLAQSAGVNENAVIYLVNPEGQLVVSTDSSRYLVEKEEFQQLGSIYVPSSKLIQFSSTNEEVMVSTASITGTDLIVILIEPWTAIMKPVRNYQMLIAGLAIIGVVLSLVTLYMAMGRIIKPIQILADNAAGAVPGSIFYPVKDSLTNYTMVFCKIWLD